jgi:hypothetical protein
MSSRTTDVVAIIMIGGFFVLSAACSSAPATTDDGTGSEQAQTGQSSSGSSGGSSATPPTTTPPATSDADLACGKLGKDACETCCENNHPTGSTLYWDKFYSCICVAQRCATECGQTDCSDDDNSPDPTPGDACDLCEQKYSNDQGTGECDVQIDAVCDGNADCSGFSTCYDQCP